MIFTKTNKNNLNRKFDCVLTKYGLQIIQASIEHTETASQWNLTNDLYP